MTTVRQYIRWLAAGTLIVAACAGPDGATEDAPVSGSAASAAARDDALVPGTPAGGLEDWVAQISAGLATMVEQLEGDVPAASQTALDLYLSRQEYIEMYWGAQGRLRGEGTELLSELVLDAEDAFHDLLKMLAVTPVDRTDVESIANTINERLHRVLAEARALDVALFPPGNAAVGEEGSRP